MAVAFLLGACSWLGAPASGPSGELDTLHWERLGAVDRGDVTNILIGFDGGYVAAGAGQTSVAASADGVHWEAVSLADVVAHPCPQAPEFDSAEAWVTMGATNGTAVLLVGDKLAFTPETCASGEVQVGSVAWLSTDGKSWVRSGTFGGPGSFVTGVWYARDAWMAAVNYTRSDDTQPEIWRSADARTWALTGSVPGSAGGLGPAIRLSDGRLLALASTGLLVSTGGTEWSPVDVPTQVGESQAAVVTNLAASPSGVVLAVTRDAAGSRVWTSTDLQTWDGHAFPDGRSVWDVQAFSEGFVATSTRCFPPPAEPACAEPDAQYVSVDGRDWRLLGGEIGNVQVSDGPLGVLAVHIITGETWLLEPTLAREGLPAARATN